MQLTVPKPQEHQFMPSMKEGLPGIETNGDLFWAGTTVEKRLVLRLESYVVICRASDREVRRHHDS
jgi:hypothetical protein